MVDKVVLMFRGQDCFSAPLSAEQLRTADVVRLPADKALSYDRLELRSRENACFQLDFEPVEIGVGDVVCLPMAAIRQFVRTQEFQDCVPTVEPQVCLLDRILEDE